MLLLIVAGLAACLPHWAQSNPGVRGLRDAFRPVEGFIGLAAIVWGAVWIVFQLINISAISVAPIAYIFSMIVGVLLLGVGFTLGGKALASSFGDSGAGKQLATRHTQLAPRRYSLGTSALITAALSIVLSFANS